MNLAQHRVKILVILPLVSSIVLGFGIYQLFYTSSLHLDSSSKTFVYEWSYGEGLGWLRVGGQRIVNGTLRLEIMFETMNDTVNIVAKINDDDYYEVDFLSLVFDRSGNGFIDIGEVDFPYMLTSTSKTYDRDILLEKDYTIYFLGCYPPRESPYHTCTFTDGVGYTFNIHFPRNEIIKPGSANMVYIYFWDGDILSAVTEYHYVSVMIEGWR